MKNTTICLLGLSILVFSSLKTKSQDQTKNEVFYFYRNEVETTKYFEENKVEPFSISFVGNGNIQRSISEGDEIPVNTGVGVQMEKYFVRKTEDGKFIPETFMNIYKINLDVTFNVASTADTLRGELLANNRIANESTFGSSILTPLNSGQAFSFDFYAYLDKPLMSFLPLRLINGLEVHYVGSNRLWELQDTAGATTVNKTTLNKFRIGVFHEFVPIKSRKTYSVTIGAAVAYNSISGDASFEGKEDFRKIILGTNQREFFGVELNSQIRLKNIRATFGYTIMPESDQVDGLSGGQLVTTIGFVGGFGLNLNE